MTRQLLVALLVGTQVVGPVPNAVAQGRVARGGIAPRTPTLISDCDLTVTSCGGDPTFEGGSDGTSQGSGGASSPPVCGSGQKNVCNVTTTRACTEWHVTGSRGEFYVSSLVGVTFEAGVTITCQTWSTSVQTYRYN